MKKYFKLNDQVHRNDITYNDMKAQDYLNFITFLEYFSGSNTFVSHCAKLNDMF